MQRKLIIHPGIGKTGTSAVQHFLHSHVGVFEGIRYHYPTHGLDNDFAHNLLSPVHPRFNSDNFDKHISNIISDVQSSTDECVHIISSEFLAHCDRKFIDRLILSFRQGFTDISVIFSVRNYIDLLYSSYLQAVKSKFGIINGEGIKDYGRRMGDGFSFPILLGKWSSADSIKFINYDECRDNYLQRFADACGMKIDVTVRSNKYINSSIIEDIVPLIFEYDRREHTPGQREKFINNMKEFSNLYNDYGSSSMRDILIKDYQEKWTSDLAYLKNTFIEI